MTLSRTLLLGLLAGATILIGLPIGRLRRPATGLRVLLNAAAVGVLLFLLWDVMSAAWEPIDEALAGMHDGEGGLGSALGYGVLFAGGMALGLLSLVFYEQWMKRRARALTRTYGPGAMVGRRARCPPGSTRRVEPRPTAGPADRRRDRLAQLRRGPGDRTVRRQR